MIPLLDGVSWLLLVAGAFFCVAGAIGLVRMPDFYTRMHAASVTDTVGAGLMLLGMMVQAGLSLLTVKLVIVAMLIYFSSPSSTHALARAGMMRGIEPLLGPQERKPSKR